MFGDLTLADGQYGGSKGRRWKVDWNKTPQPVQVKLKTLRGVKDKLPGMNCKKQSRHKGLIHWDRVTHICVSNVSIIGSDNGLSPGRRQAIIWTNAGILLIGPLGTNFNEILI